MMIKCGSESSFYHIAKHAFHSLSKSQPASYHHIFLNIHKRYLHGAFIYLQPQGTTNVGMNKAALSSSSFSPLPPTYPCSRISQPILLTPRVFPLEDTHRSIIPWIYAEVGVNRHRKAPSFTLPPGRKIPSTRHASFFLSFLHDVIPWADPQFHSGALLAATTTPPQAHQHFNPIKSDLHGFLSFSTYRYISD